MTSLWPYAAILPVLVVIAAVIARWVPFYRRVLMPSSSERYAALDGLRGYLALAVFFSHAATYNEHFHRQCQWWHWPNSLWYTLSGKIPVILFFMLTGFLYWGRVMRGPIEAKPFYRGRFWRLMPPYLALVAIVLVVVGIVTGFQLRVGVLQLAREICLLALPIRGGGSLNGVELKPLMGVVWMLRFQWVFYLALPFMGTFVRPWRFVLLCAGVGAIYAWFLTSPHVGGVHLALSVKPYFWIIFFFGMAAAQVMPLLPPISPRERHWLSAAALLCLAFACLVAWSLFDPQHPHKIDEGYRLSVYIPLAVAFLFFTRGADLFGILNWRASRMLGTISYCFFLLHMVVLYVVLHVVNHYHRIVDMTPAVYWSVAGAAAVLAVLCATIAYRWIEHPFLHVGSKRPAKPKAQPAEALAGAASGG